MPRVIGMGPVLEENSEQIVELTTDPNDENEPPTKKRRLEKPPPKTCDGKYFTILKYKAGENIDAKCKLCPDGSKVVAAATNGTGNFIRHIKKHHPEDLDKFNAYIENKKASAQLAIDSRTQTKITDYQFTFEQLKNLSLEFIIASNTPISIVALTEFKRLLESASGKSLKIPSVHMITKELKDKYFQHRQQLQILLDKMPYVCTTADVWSKRAQSYLGVMVHFIDDSYRRHSYLLAFRKLKGQQTHKILGKSLADIHDEFNLPVSKITHCITDGGSNFCSAFKKFGNNINNVCDTIDIDDSYSGSEEEESNTNDFVVLPEVSANILDLQEITLPRQLRCFAHLLNLIGKTDFLMNLKAIDPATNGLFNDIYSKLRLIWNAFARRSVAKSIIRAVLGCSLITPGDTRWNSEFDSMEFIEKKKDKISLIVAKVNANSNASSKKLEDIRANEWIIIHDYILLMRPIAVSLDRMQSDHSTAGAILPCLNFIKRELQQVRLESEKSLNHGIQMAGQKMKQALLTSFTKRFEKTMSISNENKELIIASVCHPAFKLDWVEPEDLSTAQYIFEDEADKFFETDNTNHQFESDSHSTRDYFLVNRRGGRRMSTDTLAGEIQQYLTNENVEFAILNLYKTIRKMFFRFNTSISSSAPIERSFSKAQLIFVPRRNRLSDENFEYSLFLKVNKSLFEQT